MRHLCLVLFGLTMFMAVGCSDSDNPSGPPANPYRGDVNLNTIAFEIADVVMFSEYFTKGLAVFTKNQDNQTAATDMNDDGTTLSVSDFVFGVRVIIGDAPGIGNPPTTPVSVRYTINGSNQIEILDGVRCGAMRLIIKGQANPILLNTDMEMKWEYNGINSWVFVFSMEGNSFTGNILSFQGEVISIELATAEGNPGIPSLLPTQSVYPLDQNYPNPFGPGTVDTSITFLAAVATDYTVTISNVMGVEVESIHGHTEAGVCTVDLDFSGYESGIYFYRLEAPGVEFTRKLLVLN